MAIAVHESAALAAEERVAGHALGEVAVEADEGAVAFVALQELELVAQTVENIDAGLFSEFTLVRHAADHAHGETAVSARILDHPIFAFRAGAENAGADDVRRHQVVITAQPRGWDGVVGFFRAEERVGDEGRLHGAALALGNRIEDDFAKIGRFAPQFLGTRLVAEVVQDGGQIAQPAPAICIRIQRVNLLADVAGIIVFR
jgi:hypothetical protein